MNVAAWGVVDATTQTVLSAGHVHGALQTTPRAELCATLSALRWVARHRAVATLWIDAKHVASGVCLLLQGFRIPSHFEHGDLWQVIEACTQMLDPHQVTVQHIPSHLDPAQCQDEFESWVCKWNGHVDTVAAIYNLTRPHSFAQLLETARLSWCRTASYIRSLRKLYFTVAEEGIKVRQHEASGLSRLLKLRLSRSILGMIACLIAFQ